MKSILLIKFLLIIHLCSGPLSAQFGPVLLTRFTHDNSMGSLTSIFGRNIKAKFSPNSKLVVTFAPLYDTVTMHNALTGELVWNTQFGKEAPVIPESLEISFQEYLKTTIEEPLKKFLGGPSWRVTNAEFSPDGKKLLVSIFNWREEIGQVLLLDAPTGNFILELKDVGHADQVAFSPDGKRIFTGSSKSGYPAKLWNADSGELLSTPTFSDNMNNRPSPLERVSKIVFDGAHFYTLSGNDSEVSRWDAKNGKYIDHIGYSSYTSFAVSPNNNLIVLDNGPNIQTMVRLFNLSSKKEMATLDRRDAGFYSDPISFLPSSFSPDGLTIMTAHIDGHIKLWDYKGKLLHTIEVQGLKAATFSPDGSRILTHDGNYAQVWDTQTAELIIDFGNLSLPLSQTKNDKSASAQWTNDSIKIILISGTKVSIWALPPRIFIDKKALENSKNALSLGAVKALLSSYLTHLHINKKPTLNEFVSRFPKDKQAALIELLRDLAVMNKELGAYLYALFPELRE